MSCERVEELPQAELDYLADRSVDISERIARARELVVTRDEICVLVAETGVMDGQPFGDPQVPDGEINRIANEYGFPQGEYETSGPHEWRTRSSRYPDLTLRIQEGPIETGGPSELFPSGRAWSKYDYTNTVSIVVNRSSDTT